MELDGATVKGGAVDISSDAGDENLLKVKAPKVTDASGDLLNRTVEILQ